VSPPPLSIFPFPTPSLCFLLFNPLSRRVFFFPTPDVFYYERASKPAKGRGSKRIARLIFPPPPSPEPPFAIPPLLARQLFPLTFRPLIPILATAARRQSPSLLSEFLSTLFSPSFFRLLESTPRRILYDNPPQSSFPFAFSYSDRASRHAVAVRQKPPVLFLLLPLDFLLLPLATHDY